MVVGAGTGIGKTYLTAALTQALRAAGRSVITVKPLASGVPSLADPDFLVSDTALLLAAQDLPVTAETVAACTPWRFAAPLAPDLAAAREGRHLSLDDLVAWCEQRFPAESPTAAEGNGGETGSQDEPVLLIEGVGGVMSPVTDEATGLDWLKALGLPALLVSGSYLGSISHTLTAAETLRAHAVRLAGIVVSESLDAPVPPEIVAQAIARHVAAPVLVLHRGAPCPEGLVALV